MSCDPDYRVVPGVDPDISLEQVFVLPFRGGMNDQAMVGTENLLPEQLKFIIGRLDRTVVVNAAL